MQQAKDLTAPGHTPNSKAIRVLLIDDEEETYLMVSSFLRRWKDKKTFEVDWIHDVEQARTLFELAHPSHDVCILDWNFGSTTAETLLREKLLEKCLFPVILLSGNRDLETALKALNYGAWNFVAKGNLNADQLGLAILFAIRNFSPA